MSYQVVVTTVPGQPTFLVGSLSPIFINEVCERLFGRQENGEPHEWHVKPDDESMHVTREAAAQESTEGDFSHYKQTASSSVF